ncbi:glycosyltransferase family 4 protein [Vulcanisaeta sp. JCM 16161]|uniref:glycosyltransferase family 4 protein n=1 Tax=Vulcanisaeta sp. JCM 16161 TaxID=1295372 RepID=UPI000AF74B6B|nr:glycosyltransferase family 4 protein [Vulcanisaeta sp. JCM 16161]
MRIVFVGWDVGIAGGNRAIFEVANRLSERGHSVNIVALGGDHSWFNVKVPVHYINVPPMLDRLLLVYRVARGKLRRRYKALDTEGFAKRLGFHADLIRLLAEHLPNADVYIATWYPTALSVWLGSRDGSKRLFFMQDFPELVKDADGDYGLRLFKLVLSLPFTFVANSNFARNLILESNPSARVYVSGVGVDTSIFYPRRVRVIDSKGRHVVMAIIRGGWYKGADVAVKTLNELNKKLPIMGLLVGDKNIINNILSKIKPEFPYTIFSNVNDDELARLYSSADLFLYTSYVEGFGLPPLEAMACGTPVVMTDAKGNRDYAVNGYNGIVVEPGNIEALANAAYQVLTNQELRDKLIQGGLETARKWTWDRVVDVLENAMREA